MNLPLYEFQEYQDAKDRIEEIFEIVPEARPQKELSRLMDVVEQYEQQLRNQIDKEAVLSK